MPNPTSALTPIAGVGIVLRNRPAWSKAFGLVKSYDPALMRIVQSGKAKEDLLAA